MKNLHVIKRKAYVRRLRKHMNRTCNLNCLSQLRDNEYGPINKWRDIKLQKILIEVLVSEALLKHGITP